MSKVGMRRETTDERPDVRRETTDASRVSCLASRDLTGPNWPARSFEQLFSEPSRNGFYSPNPTGPISAKIVGMGTLFHNDFIRSVDSQDTDVSPAEFDRFSVCSGDLLFGRRSLVESGAGKVSLVCSLSESAIFESSLIRVRLNENLALPQFYLYFFKSRYGRSLVSSIVTGTNVKGIRSSELSKILVPLPPLSEQRRIVGILSAYDDLIENNRKRIALLEESARKLYKEWFVRGGQSRGATLGKVADFFDISIGRTPPRKNEEFFSTENTDLKWLSIKDMRASRVFALDTAEKLTNAGIDKSRIHISPPGTVFLSFKLTIGEVVIAGDSMATNEAIAHFETDDRALRDYTYFYLSSFQYDKLGSTSSIAKAVNSDLVRRMDFVLPTRTDLDRFEERVAPVFDQMENLSRQNITLATARDALLPRLMKGGVG